MLQEAELSSEDMRQQLRGLEAEIRVCRHAPETPTHLLSPFEAMHRKLPTATFILTSLAAVL